MLDSNLQDDPESILIEAAEFDYDISILEDAAQVVGEALGVVHAAEVFVIETGSWNLVYHGPIDDRMHSSARLSCTCCEQIAGGSRARNP
jgi:hypothetical protein